MYLKQGWKNHYLKKSDFFEVILICVIKIIFYIVLLHLQLFFDLLKVFKQLQHYNITQLQHNSKCNNLFDE